MTKKEIAEIIESKAAEYGFEIGRYPIGWAARQTKEKINGMELSYTRTF